MSSNYPDDIGQYNWHPMSPYYNGPELDEPDDRTVAEAKRLVNAVFDNREHELAKAIALIWSGMDAFEGAARIRELMEKEHARI